MMKIFPDLISDSVSSFFGLGAEQQSTTDFYLERQEFDPAVFQLCADNQRVRMRISVTNRKFFNPCSSS